MDHGIVGGSLKSQQTQIRGARHAGAAGASRRAADSIPIASPDLNVSPGRLAPVATMGHQRVENSRRNVGQISGAFRLGPLQGLHSSVQGC